MGTGARSSACLFTSALSCFINNALGFLFIDMPVVGMKMKMSKMREMVNNKDAKVSAKNCRWRRSGI